VILTENDVFQNRAIQPMFKVDIKIDASKDPYDIF